MERAISIYPLNLKATAHDHAASTLVATSAEALGRHTPWADRMTACSCLALTTTVRVIDRVHHHTADGRTHAAPTHRTSLTDGTQAVLGVAHFAQRRLAVDVHLADFAGTQTQLSVTAFAGQQLHCSTRGTGQLRALARQHLDAVNGRTHRNVAQRQSITRLDRSFGAADQRSADRNALG